MGCDFTGTVYVSIEDFMRLLAKQNPTLNNGGEWVFGNIRVTDDALEVDVAYSDTCDPRTWANPPEWIKR